jgi:hypothetical protein
LGDRTSPLLYENLEIYYYLRDTVVVVRYFLGHHWKNGRQIFSCRNENIPRTSSANTNWDEKDVQERITNTGVN